MTAITGIAYGTSSRTVMNHAVGAAEIICSCWARKSRPVIASTMTNSQKAGWWRWKNPVCSPQVEAGAGLVERGWAVMSASRVLDGRRGSGRCRR